MHIIKLNAIDSTNTYLKELSAKQTVANFTVVVAENQTNGRGQRGANWEVEKGKNLTFSVLKINPSTGPRNQFMLNILVSLSIVKALESFNVPKLSIKWPNDILIDDKKVAGLLAQQIGDGVIVGIGLNVAMGADELPVPTATSLALAGSNNLDRNSLLSAFLNLFENIFKEWDSGGDFLEKYRQISSTLGRQIRVEVLGRDPIEAEAVAISAQGALILIDGTEVNAGDVVHLR